MKIIGSTRLYAFDATACINKRTHRHAHKCKRLHWKPVAPMWEYNCATLCIGHSAKGKPLLTKRERFRLRKKGKIFQTSSLFCFFWVTDYIDGFGHSRPDLELPLLKSNSSGACKGKASMDKANNYTQNEPHWAIFFFVTRYSPNNTHADIYPTYIVCHSTKIRLLPFHLMYTA